MLSVSGTTSNIAVILAREGSKRVPGKNLKEFCGTPLITYPIKAALSSKSINYVFVSSDDRLTLSIAESLGALPILRPKALADDSTPTIPVVRQAITHVEGLGFDASSVCCLYGANPFVDSNEISRAYEKLINSSASFVFSAVKYSYPIDRGFVIGDDDKVTMINPDAYSLRTQDCRTVYHDADLYYWGRRESWLKEDVIFGPNATAIVYSYNSAFPIDTIEDWSRAEVIFMQKKNEFRD